MKYSVDIKLTGFEQVVVEADSEEDAHEKALARLWEIYESEPASDLRWKTTESTITNTWE